MALFSALQKFITKEGQPVEGASVLVKLAGSATAATLYATRDGGAKGNPFLTSADGNALCYVSPGRYDMTVTFNAEQVTFADVEVGPVSNVGTFAAGGVVTDPDQLVEDDDGNKWRWTGSLNYAFAPGEDPETVVGWSRWADAAGTTAAFEQALAAADSTKQVGGEQASRLGKSYGARLRFAMRQSTDGGGWAPIVDAAHEAMGFASASVDVNGRLVLNYDVTADKVGALIVAADETYSGAGIFFGASVAENTAVVSAFGPISGRVTGAASAGIIKNGGLSPDFSQVVDAAAGSIVVTHAAITHTDSVGYPVITSKYGTQAGELVCAISSKTGFTLQYKEPLKGVITNGGGTPAYTGQNTGVSVVFNTDHFLVTHPAVSTLNKSIDIQDQQASGAPYLYRVGTDMTATTFKVYLYDLAGTLITTPASTVRFSFCRNELAPAAMPTTTFATVHRMGIPIDFNDLFNPSANIWVIGDHYFDPAP